jgi:hypothetical protein
MRSKNSYRPQNQKPDGLVQSRKRLAEQHYEQVRVTVQAMVRRGTKSDEISIPAVAKESGVSVATLYRRSDLFDLIQRANPKVQRRQAEHVYQSVIERLQAELEKARADVVYYQKEAQMAKLGEQRPQQEVTQLKKTILALQRQVTCLEELLDCCTCGVSLQSIHLSDISIVK